MPESFAPVGVEPRSTAAQQDPTPPQTSPQPAAVPVPQPQPYGNLVSQQRSGQSTFYHFDALGSAAALTTSTQTVSDSYTYRAFGDIAASSGTTTNPYQWVGRQGYYRDQEASELNLGRRHYDTATGRFTTEDPIGYHSGDSNFYRYVGNNPIVRVDPDGLQPPQPPKLSPPPPASYSSVARSAVRLGSKFAAEMSSGVYKAFGKDGKVSDLLDPLDRFLTELQPLTRTAEQSGLLTSGMGSQIRGLLSDLISLIREVKAILPEDAVQVALDLVQVILGVIGLIPLLGEAADAVDAGISLARRDWIGTGLGVVNLIPVVSIATGAAVLFARKFPRLVAGIKGLGPKARQLLQLIKSRLSKALEILPEPVKRRLEGFLKTLDDAAPPEPKLTPPERRTLETPPSIAKSEQLKTIPEKRIEKVESASEIAPSNSGAAASKVIDPQLDNNLLSQLANPAHPNHAAAVAYAEANKAAGLSVNRAAYKEFLQNFSKDQFSALREKYGIKLIREISLDELDSVAQRLRKAFDGTGRAIGEGDAKVAASALLRGEKLATNDLQFFKRAKDLGLNVEYVGSGNAAANAAKYVPQPVTIP